MCLPPQSNFSQISPWGKQCLHLTDWNDKQALSILTAHVQDSAALCSAPEPLNFDTSKSPISLSLSPNQAGETGVNKPPVPSSLISQTDSSPVNEWEETRPGPWP